MSLPSWSPKTPQWSGDHIQLLLETKIGAEKNFSVEKIISNSEKFPIKFPVDTVRLKTIKNKTYITEEFLTRNINSVYPFVHDSVLELYTKFIFFKRNHGSSIEKAFYKDIGLKEFIARLLMKRAVIFMGKNDKFLLVGGEKGSKNWETIGTEKEKPPQTLKNCLSYDEIKLSAFLYASSYTHFLNKGDRKNKAVYSENRSEIEDEGIIAGMIGPRLKKENVMDFQEIVISPKQNQKSHGYGKDCKISTQSIFFDFYEEENLDYQSVIKKRATLPPTESSRYTDLKNKQKDYLFDNLIYQKRLTIVFDCLLLEANSRANKVEKSAYVHVVGLGLGVWKISDHQEEIFMSIFHQRILALGESISSISDICFSYISQESCGRYKNGETVPIKNHPLKGIKIHIFKRDPHEKLTSEHKGKLLVVSFAWDGNALPGNEFWEGKLGSSGDSAAASSTQISELHNSHINPGVSVDNLRVVCKDKIVKFGKYIEKVKKRKLNSSLENTPRKKVGPPK